MPHFLVHDERFSSNPLIALAFSDTAPIVAWHGRHRAFHIQAAGARSLSPVSLRVPRGFLVSHLSGPGTTTTEPVSNWSIFLSVTGRSDYIFPLSGPYQFIRSYIPDEVTVRTITCHFVFSSSPVSSSPNRQYTSTSNVLAVSSTREIPFRFRFCVRQD